jgi:hypothetical protein
MPNETEDDRRFYEGQFARLHKRLDDIFVQMSDFRSNCARNHARDKEFLHIMDGNGKPPLSVRLAILEQSEPSKKERVTFFLALSGVIASGLLVAVEAVAAIFKK